MHNNTHTRTLLVVIVVLCFFLQPLVLKAETAKPDSAQKHQFVDMFGGYGFVMPHHTSIAYHVNEHITPFHLRWGIKTRGTKLWHHQMGFPTMGIGLYRSNLGNDDIYGKATAVYGFASWPLYKPLNLEYQIGFGIAHLTKTFDIEDNYTNIAIGSHLNIYFDATIKTHIPINKNWQLLYFLQFTHFSNGKMQSPNKGLNLITNNLGISYHFGNFNQCPNPTVPSSVQSSKNRIDLWAGIGMKTISRSIPGKKFASTLGLQYRRSTSTLTSWGGGLDLFYDESLRQNPELMEAESSSNFYQLGLHADMDKHIERFSLTLQIGGYLYTAVDPEAPLYTRLGIRYQVNHNIWCNLSLKAHYAIASFIEWGIGYNLWKS
jgi:hypothetical protein